MRVICHLLDSLGKAVSGLQDILSSLLPAMLMLASKLLNKKECCHLYLSITTSQLLESFRNTAQPLEAFIAQL